MQMAFTRKALAANVAADRLFFAVSLHMSMQAAYICEGLAAGATAE